MVAEPTWLQIDPYDEPNDDEYDYESYAIRQRQPHGGSTLMMTTQVTTKVPPGFDGKTSWFAFEDAIDDWCDITELEQEKWGPALRNRLVGEAAVYKRLLDRDELRQPNGRGVLYFKKNTETTLCERSSDSISLQIFEVHEERPWKWRFDEMDDKIPNRWKKTC